MSYILSIDAGTSSCRAILYNSKAEVMANCQQEIKQYFPHSGWVEHDAEEIFDKVLITIQEVLKVSGVSPLEIKGVGITNQRETVVAWRRSTSRPLAKAIVWQDRRTSAICDQWKEKDREKLIKNKTGLVLDAYFSATKINWLIKNNSAVQEAIAEDDICFGTIDSWLCYKLSSGNSFITDVSNASRTMLFNINTLQWDEQLCNWAGVKKDHLPEVVPSSGKLASIDSQYLDVLIPITGIAGDQQAALYGHQAVEPGMAKNTYGTGCFMLMNTGKEIVISDHGLLTTIAWQLDDQVHYALEGSIYMAGAIIQWLRDELNMINKSAEVESLALSVDTSGGVFLVPAFTGLGAPFWDSEVRASLLGMTRNTGRAHIARAALDAIAFQTRAVLESMQNDSGIQLTSLSVDGGATTNNLLMQIQADQLNICIERAREHELTALGAAMLAGRGVGLWTDSDLKRIKGQNDKFSPLKTSKTDRHYTSWLRAVTLIREFKNSDDQNF